ncbi:hypothetical protein AAEX28_13620 [Lentisphaerota bacterium WC36G]|nr:hypothetical protein LJT99_00375 [Lentisphaerae bacterium WC36]
MEKTNIKDKKFTKMTVLVKPHEFSQFLQIPRRTLLEKPRAILSTNKNDVLGYILQIIEEQ